MEQVFLANPDNLHLLNNVASNLRLDDILNLKRIKPNLNPPFSILDETGRITHFPSLTPENIRKYRQIQKKIGQALIKAIRCHVHGRDLAFSRRFPEGCGKSVWDLLSLDYDVRVKDDREASPLVLAMRYDYPDIIQQLLANPNIDINELGPGITDTPLLIWSFEQMVKSSQPSKEEDREENIEEQEKRRKLYQTIFQKVLARKDVDLNATDRRGGNLLGLSIILKQQDLFRWLMQQENINPNLPDGSNNTPLVLAIKENNLEAVRLLLQNKNIEVNSVNGAGETALILSTDLEPKNANQIIRLLLQNKDLEINHKNWLGGSALVMLIANQDLDNTVLLLDKTYQNRISQDSLILKAEQLIQEAQELSKSNLGPRRIYQEIDQLIRDLEN